jgi:hypothetical protein
MIHIKRILFFFSPILFLLSCSGNSNEKNENIGFRKNIFNPFHVDQIFNTPNNFGSFWVSNNVKQLNVNKINLILKGGDNPDNVLEKYVYEFNSKGQNNNYSYFNFSTQKEAINETNFEYSDNLLSKINIYKYFGVGNLPPLKVYYSDNYTVFCKSKANGKNDSLFFYPSVDNPKLIVDKIGKFVNYMEVIIKHGATKKEILNQISAYQPYLSEFDLAEKTITYTKNNLPFESYHLGDNWTQLQRSQYWEYNKFNQVILFKEWLHGTLIKDINILYNENSLPKKIIFNRKKYILIYSNSKDK